MSRTVSHLRTLLALMRAQRGTYAPGLIFVVISTITALAYPYAIRLTIDEGIGGGRPERITSIALVMLALLLAEGVATLGRDYLFGLGAERACADLRHRTFEHLLRQDISFFDSRTTGELSARLWTDIPNLQRLLGDELSDGLRFGLWAIGGTALLFYTSPLLSVLVFLAVPTLVVAATALGHRVRRYSAAGQQRNRRDRRGMPRGNSNRAGVFAGAGGSGAASRTAGQVSRRGAAAHPRGGGADGAEFHDRRIVGPHCALGWRLDDR